ncbi:MAG: AAA family ATPase [Vicinamibacterales bacterium]
MNRVSLEEAIERHRRFAADLAAEIGTVVVGQTHLVERLLIGLLCDGHVLIEGPPGLAKTLVVKTLAAATALTFQRIQLTPDLLPADVIGTLIYHPGENRFAVHKGPVFANLVLADEIDRAPAKVQSALLEAMQEHRVTIGRETYSLDEPFLVLATQNPIEHEGTYALPEAQLDRFLLHVVVRYPTREEELEILQRQLAGASSRVRQVAGWTQIETARHLLTQIYVDPVLQRYVLDLVQATRTPDDYGLQRLAPVLRYGVSPRAAVHFTLAARAHALLEGRAFVLPEDVRDVCPDVLRHRLLLTDEAEADTIATDEVVGEILRTVPVP